MDVGMYYSRHNLLTCVPLTPRSGVEWARQLLSQWMLPIRVHVTARETEINKMVIFKVGTSKPACPTLLSERLGGLPWNVNH